MEKKEASCKESEASMPPIEATHCLQLLNQRIVDEDVRTPSRKRMGYLEIVGIEAIHHACGHIQKNGDPQAFERHFLGVTEHQRTRTASAYD
jgi:hypothetical protein